MFGPKGRSAEQRIILNLLLDDSVEIVSLGGRAGAGKSALTLRVELESMLKRGLHRRIVIFRPLYAVSGQSFGHLPGSEGKKVSSWTQTVYDTLKGLVSEDVMDEVTSRGMLEVLPLAHIRSRSLHDNSVTVGKAQSLEHNVLLTVLSRLGSNPRVILTHDVIWRGSLRVGRHDGVQVVIEKLKGNGLFAHITLKRLKHSKITELVTNILDQWQCLSLVSPPSKEVSRRPPRTVVQKTTNKRG